GANHPHRVAMPRGDEDFGHGEGEDVARAGGADVEGGGVLGPDEGLEIAGSARKQAIRTGGREHDGVEIGGGDTGTPHRALTRFAAQHGDALVRAGDAALPDAGALDDPLVRGVQRQGKVGIGEHVRRHANTHARHLREWARHHERTAVSRWANSAAMCWVRPARTACTATRMAFLMALGLEDPWQMMATPRTPSSGAPP